MRERLEGPSDILPLLRVNPRGLTVSEIAKELGYNRNSAAKYLEILAAEGKVTVRNIGTAKVFSVARRVPLSAFLCFTKNMILVLDDRLTVVQANDQYLKLAGTTKTEILGRNVADPGLPVVSDPEALGLIRTTGKEQVIADIRPARGKEECFYQIEVIPTTFEGGDTGLTIVLEDITERKRHVRNMEFLARTARELVDLPAEADIFEYVAETIAELLPGLPKVYVESYDEVNRQFFMKAMFRPEVRDGCSRIVGQNIVGMKFPIREFLFIAPFFETPSSLREMREMHFRPFFEDEQISFYDVCLHQFSREACEGILRKYRIGKLFLTGLVWQEQLYGVVGICLCPDEELTNRTAIESFIRQASIEISRRMTGERLARCRQRFSDLIDFAHIPALVIDRDGRCVKVNQEFTDTFGYTLEDILAGGDDLDEALPGIRDHGSLGASRTSRSITVRCRDGTHKPAVFSTISLGEGTKVLSYEPGTQ
ncbi:MAG: PAS domain S-box protein [Methanoregulaceae archaeon]|nr:PAS domain S-box protein [Methanoregulaceae archaeon]